MPAQALKFERRHAIEHGHGGAADGDGSTHGLVSGRGSFGALEG